MGPMCMCYWVCEEIFTNNRILKFLAIPWKRHCVRLKHTLRAGWHENQVGLLRVHWTNVNSLALIFWPSPWMSWLVFKPVRFLYFLYMTCPFYVDRKNQAAVIFLSQRSIPLEQQTMIPLFDEITDEVNIYQLKIILLLWYHFDTVSDAIKV